MGALLLLVNKWLLAEYEVERLEGYSFQTVGCRCKPIVDEMMQWLMSGMIIIQINLMNSCCQSVWYRIYTYL